MEVLTVEVLSGEVSAMEIVIVKVLLVEVLTMKFPAVKVSTVKITAVQASAVNQSKEFFHGKYRCGWTPDRVLCIWAITQTVSSLDPFYDLSQVHDNHRETIEKKITLTY